MNVSKLFLGNPLPSQDARGEKALGFIEMVRAVTRLPDRKLCVHLPDSCGHSSAPPMHVLDSTASLVLPGLRTPIKNGASGLANQAQTPPPSVGGGRPSSKPATVSLTLNHPQTQHLPPTRRSPLHLLSSPLVTRSLSIVHVSPPRSARSDDITHTESSFNPRLCAKNPACSASRLFPSISCDLGLMPLSLS